MIRALRTVTLPDNVWRSVDAVLADFLTFGPGELDSEYIPDEHLEKARKAINRTLETQTKERRRRS